MGLHRGQARFEQRHFRLYSRNDRCRAFSFSERRVASGHEELIPCVSLDETLRENVSRDPIPPLKRIKLTEASSRSHAPIVDGADPRARRHAQNLRMEASIRIQTASISRSWRGVQSGIASYARFMDGTLPQVRHFPVTLVSLRLWALHFDNGDTLRTYVSHLRFAHRVMNLPPIEAEDIAASIIRGARRDTVCRVKPRVSGPHLDATIRQSIREGDILAARAYAVAYSFLFRCQSQLFGIQIDGRGSGTRHQSHLVVREGSAGGLPAVAVHLTSRKNSPKGAVVSRPCFCRRNLRSIRCGHCSLKAIVASHIRNGGSKRDPILSALMTSGASRRLRQRGAILGIERCSWHAFRRGAASDIMRSGGTVGFLMNQGGWRSGAFLRYFLAPDVEDRRALEVIAAGLDSDSD